MLNTETAFRLLYGRDPDRAEADRLESLMDGTETELDLMRRIIGASDRQTLGTPVLIRMGANDVRFVQLDGFQLATDRTDIAVAHEIVGNGVYEEHLTALFREVLRPGMSFVDVGANIGYFTMLASRLVGPTGTVSAFEPNTENCRQILLSVSRNGFDNIKLYPLALTESIGSAFFSSAIGSNGALLSSADETLMNPNCLVVATAPMTLLIDKVDVIKMDVEGAEGVVVKGALPLIERRRPIVTAEFSMEMIPRVSGMSGLEFIEMFTRLNYRVELLDRVSRTNARTLIDDPAAFVANYGPLTRIEDLVFLPN